MVKKIGDMKTVTNNINWREVAEKMSEDKKRIHAYKSTPEEQKINDIKFVKPFAVRDCRAK